MNFASETVSISVYRVTVFTHSMAASNYEHAYENSSLTPHDDDKVYQENNNYYQVLCSLKTTTTIATNV